MADGERKKQVEPPGGGEAGIWSEGGSSIFGGRPWFSHCGFRMDSSIPFHRLPIALPVSIFEAAQLGPQLKRIQKKNKKTNESWVTSTP